MKRPIATLMAAGVLVLALSACDDITGAVKANADANLATAKGQAAQGEAKRLEAEADRAQIEAQRETTKALIAAQDSHIADYRAILIMSFVLAALSMGLSVALAFALRRVQVQTPRITYQLMPPQVPPAQIGTPATWPEIRAKQRAVAQLQARNTERYKI